ncbi:MAG: AGE family epimerase/isomerase [Rhizobiales bacterium]|nr:AGE family epimerase/isomerase [Hyphomicrobiales bacterium]
MTSWRTSPYHRQWLLQQADGLFDFFQYSSLNPKGGFFDLYDDGRPIGNLRQLHATTRMVHCMALGHLLGRPGAAAMVDHGMEYIWRGHRDQKNGGYMWSLDDSGPRDDSKQAYGHAFVLLASASAKCVGHPLADKVLADVTEILETRFWEASPGVTSEEYARDWSKISDYRGQNSNMHLTEALMAAFEATGEGGYLGKAESIASFIIGKHAAALDYRVAEHFDAQWNIDNEYRGSDIFRPSGSTPGHWLEWARLLLQLWELGGRRLAWLPEAADRLFRNAVKLGWDHEKGGFFYTLNWDNHPRLRQKLWWPATEGIGAAAWLAARSSDPFYEDWYRRIWGFSAMHLIDHAHGGWHPELGEDLKPKRGFFTGKPDIYHALQACLIPLYPAAGSLTKVMA